MAIPFLSNINLNGNQALNLALHNKTTPPSNPTVGQIYFDTSENGVSDANDGKVFIWNGTEWNSIAGDITGISITAGAGLTGTVSTTLGDHTQTINVVGGDGITANTDEIEVTVDDVTIELSATDGSGAVQAKTAAVADGETALATGDQIHTFVTTQTDTIAASTTGTASNVTGIVAIANGGTGQTTAAAAADALLNTSQGGALSIGDANDEITIPGDLIVTGETTFINETILVAEDNTIAFEGTTSGDDLFIKLTSAEPTTTSKTITLPDATGTVALTSDINDGTLTVSGNNGLTGDGTFTANDDDDVQITLSHADTSTQDSVDNADLNVIQDVTLDTYGHVTGLGSVDLTSGIDGRITARTVVATIDISDTTLTAQTAPYKATIEHALNTKDLIVQLQDVTTFEIIHADILTTAFDGSESTSKITIRFDNTLPANNVRVIITSGAGATDGTVSYA